MSLPSRSFPQAERLHLSRQLKANFDDKLHLGKTRQRNRFTEPVNYSVPLAVTVTSETNLSFTAWTRVKALKSCRLSKALHQRVVG